ncbi:IS200/IS605 family transposase [Streptomyces chartreusis]
MSTEDDYRRDRHVVSAMPVHLVSVTKYRRGVFNDEMLDVCEATMRKVCEHFEAELIEFNGKTDHVHLLVHYPPKAAVSGLVNSLKGISAHIPRRNFTGHTNHALMHRHFWSPSYFAASCGGAPLTVMRQYIEQQRRPL